MARYRYQVFICYGGAQRQLVWEIVRQWRALDLKLFWDGDIKPGEEVVTVLDRGRERSRRTVLFITPESIKSGWVLKEINFAIYQDPALKRRLIPVVLEPVPKDSIPPSVRTLSHVDLTDKSLRKYELHRLLKWIGVKNDPQRPWPDDLPEIGASNDRADSLGRPSSKAGGGAISPDSRFYLIRKAEREIFDFYHFDEEPGQSFAIKGHTQAGKTSLLASLHSCAVKRDHASCRLDFQGWDAVTFESANDLFLEIAESITDELDLGRQATANWSAKVPKQSLTQFLQKQVLARIKKPVLLLFDEADKTFQNRTVCRQLFETLLSWHNSRATDTKPSNRKGWHHLGLVVAHTSDPVLGGRSLFDVAHQLVLDDFEDDEIVELNRRYGRPLRGRADINGLMSLVEGHPYLVRLALDEMTRRPCTFAALKKGAADDNGPFASHLRPLLNTLYNDAPLLASFRRVMNRQPIDEQVFQRLRSLGLIRGETRRRASIRSKIYANYFRTKLL